MEFLEKENPNETKYYLEAILGLSCKCLIVVKFRWKIYRFQNDNELPQTRKVFKIEIVNVPEKKTEKVFSPELRTIRNEYNEERSFTNKIKEKRMTKSNIEKMGKFLPEQSVRRNILAKNAIYRLHSKKPNMRTIQS